MSLNKTNVALLATAIENRHKCRAVHLESVQFKDKTEGRTVKDGLVEVFALIGHHTAKKCYAWIESFPHSRDDRYVIVLQKGLLLGAGT